MHHGGEGGLSGRAGPRLAVEPVLAGGEVAGGQPGHPAQRGQGNLQQQGIKDSAANRLIGEVVQSRRRPLLGPSPG